MRRPTDRSRGTRDHQKPEISAVSGAAAEVAPAAESIDISRKAPGTARIVEPAHNLRRSFGLETGSALATVPSMIDDNELASKAVVDESEVFDDPFYEALVAVESDETEEPDNPPVPTDAPEINEPESEESTVEEPDVESASPADEVDASPSADEKSAKEHGAATPAQNAEGDVAPGPSEACAPERPATAHSPEPKYGLENGSALALVPSMIDDNFLASGLVADEEEVFDDPFFEALLAVEDAAEPSETPQEAESAAEVRPTEAPVPKSEPQFGLEYGSALALVPSMIDDNTLCSELVVDETEVFDDPFFEALLAVEDAPEPSETPQESEGESKADSDEATEDMLYTTASALVEENEDEEPPRGKHARIAAEPAPETGPEPEPKAELEPEPELELSLEPKPEAVNSLAEEAANETVESEAPETAATDEPMPEDAANNEKTENASAAEEEVPARVDDDCAAVQVPQPQSENEASAEKLPDDESVADAVDAMVVDADPDEGKAPTPVAEAPAKHGFWSRLKGLFRRKK